MTVRGSQYAGWEESGKRVPSVFPVEISSRLQVNGVSLGAESQMDSLALSSH